MVLVLCSVVLSFCVFRQQVQGGSYPFLNPVRFSLVCFLLESFRPSGEFPLDSLLSHSAQNLLICSVLAATGEAQIHVCSLPDQEEYYLPFMVTPSS